MTTPDTTPRIFLWGHNNAENTNGIRRALELGLAPHVSINRIEGAMDSLAEVPKGKHPLLLYTHNIFRSLGRVGKGINPFAPASAWTQLADEEFGVYAGKVQEAAALIQATDVWQVDNHEGAEFSAGKVLTQLRKDPTGYEVFDPDGLGWEDIDGRADWLSAHIWGLYRAGLDAYFAQVEASSAIDLKGRLFLYGGAGAAYGLGGGHQGRLGAYPIGEPLPPDPIGHNGLAVPLNVALLPQNQLGKYVCFLRSLYYHLGAEDYHLGGNPERVLESMHDLDKDTRPGPFKGAIYWDGNSGYMGDDRYAANCAAMAWIDLDANVHSLWRAHTTAVRDEAGEFTEQGDRDDRAVRSLRLVLEHPTLRRFRGASSVVRREAWHAYVGGRPSNLPPPPVLSLEVTDTMGGVLSFPTLPYGRVTKTNERKGLETRELHNPGWPDDPDAGHAAQAHAIARKLAGHDIYAVHVRDFRGGPTGEGLEVTIPGFGVVRLYPEAEESWYVIWAEGSEGEEILRADPVYDGGPDVLAWLDSEPVDPPEPLTVEERLAALEVRVAALEAR